jgi:hypothetical protein
MVCGPPGCWCCNQGGWAPETGGGTLPPTQQKGYLAQSIIHPPTLTPPHSTPLTTTTAFRCDAYVCRPVWMMGMHSGGGV